MGTSERLRKALASRRGWISAAAGAAALLLTGQPAAGAPRPAWSTAWAEHELREHYHAVSGVCLPLGHATRGQGAAAFKAFVCVLVARDGTRYTIRLRPRTRYAWTVLSVDRRPAAPTQAPDGPPGKGHSKAGTEPQPE
jgi:hypothetical protein